jgi:predicted PurR-regulated permease PerM
MACLVIVLAGLRAAREVVVPVLFAGFLALVCIRPVKRLQAWGVPKVLGVVLVTLLVLVSFVGLSAVVGTSIREFSGSLWKYESRLDAVMEGGLGGLQQLGLEVSKDDLKSVLDTGAVLQLISDTTESLLSLLSDLIVIVLIMVFMLLEAEGLPAKLRLAFRKSEEEISRTTRISDMVYGFLSIKTGLNLVVGGLVTAWTAIMGVDYPFLWGLVAFVFNYIPNIGSIIAAIPPALLALIQFNLGQALVLVAGFVGINTVLGQIVEPRVMGRHLGLSPLVVIVSLFFWNWVLGPVGMLLSVPLTMVVKVILENTEDLRGVGILLGPTYITGEPPDELTLRGGSGPV